ncbi:hypothetical protein MAA_07754 [Metarhizium robertsii ARSEF 23]|uniref:Uncharacterized protein n=1 Tax=Metarhizium robertsii (strain ARSEF 23 / ATCC MYA-3075) TaxID=655844 RepID=E9F655_METRA|nr:uncharacterized protein MAA_07754 [Metarhizium robertsii ARSEF 23]EFY96693.1 hypothetical protein MAA_07754 [Metarhizium robertsii ARSEF 23]
MASRTKHTAHSTAILRFLDTEGKNIDKAFGKQLEPRPSPRSDSRPERPQGYPEEAESELPDESEGLRAALIEYQNLEIDPRLSLDVDKCTWEDVFECMAGAEADYEQKSKGWRGVGRRLLRKAGDHAEDVDPWLKLIPPEYGMGIIGAGISIMFMLARDAKEAREKILDTFAEIPIIVASAKAKLRAFPDRQELKSCSEKLNLEIIVSVSKLVGALLPEKHREKVPYFWFRSKLGKSTIDDVLKSLRGRADELKSLVQDFVYEAIGETQWQTREIKKDTSGIKHDTSILLETASKLQGNTAGLMTMTSQVQTEMRTLTSNFKSVLDNDYTRRLQIFEKKKEEAEKSRDVMARTLEEVVAEKDRECERLRAEINYMRARTPVPGLMTVEEFLGAIGASTLIRQSTEDIDKVLRLRSSIHPMAEAEAVSLLQTSAFRAWLRPGRSDAILIDGAGAAVDMFDPTERVSAKSVLCASLLATLCRPPRDPFQLFFFAGLHSSEKDPLSDGPRGMMRSLLCELVKEAYRRGWLYLDFIGDKAYRDGIRTQNIHYLCQAFRQILERMEMMEARDLSIYCVVDGIAQYEQRWYDDLAVVVGMFRRIVNDNTLKPAFKLLLTGPQRVRYVHDMLGLPPGKRLWTNAAVAGEHPAAQLGMPLAAEQALLVRRQQKVAERSGRSQYFDDMETTADDYC